MNFTSKHDWQEVDIENLSKKLGVDFDYNINSVTATVKFQLEVEAREYGIKSICRKNKKSSESSRIS